MKKQIAMNMEKAYQDLIDTYNKVPRYLITDAPIFKIKSIVSTFNIIIGRQCTITGEEYDIPLNIPRFIRWIHTSEMIQNIFPELSPEQRDFLLMNITPAEWSNIFGTEEDEGYDQDELWKSDF